MTDGPTPSESSAELSSQAPAAKRKARSVIWKVLLIGALILMMLIPLALIASIIDERKNTRDKVVDEIAQTWAGEQRLTGPVLVAPYLSTIASKDDKGRKKTQSIRKLAYLLPEQYEVRAHLMPQVRYRSIYQSVVYRSQIEIQGRFNPRALDELRLPPNSVLWSQAFVTLGIPSVKGLETRPDLQWRGKAVEFLPGVNGADFAGGGLYAPVAVSADAGDMPFKATLSLKGSQSFWMSPIGKQSRLIVTGDWPSPSFVGDTLPTTRAVKGKTFQASWEIPYFARSYGQAFTLSGNMEVFLYNSNVGVRLLTPIDAYRQADRAVKYGVLFLALTFSTYFLFEVVCKRRIHPLQYLLIGLALTLFYLLLIAGSEVIHFGWAYLIASVAIIALITLYSKAILGASKREAPLIIGGLLTALYAYLYILLRLEDWSLLFGALGLLAALAAIMFVTRHIDWYNE
ncbi:MAG: cell envelope integrity protein CreD [Vampirovibrionales bacterium]|nr:cell envelope integrity protein CreD [Vampirovibrionales bacterium]